MSAKKIEAVADPLASRDIEALFTARSTSARWVVVRHSHLWQPPTDVYETEDAFIVQVEIAGMRGADFSVSIHDRRVTVTGVRHDNGESRAYHQMEIRFGEFRTDVELPGPVDRDALEATYNDGYLKLVLPKAKAKRIEIE
ncbi:MAG: Hsp20/alpha crystallin family protein [Chloroflexi bacterium]|nr:Hsp20/alpha crystallin family protein [Chloroflexota bacterium]MBI3763217.1 Hsp20/alpha crystallin family protein [Chloroflexota bacterium]